MRISDWSSDVCSSDLRVGTVLHPVRPDHRFCGADRPGCRAYDHPDDRGLFPRRAGRTEPCRGAVDRPLRAPAALDARQQQRSEEHTSELQSLMRSSYAVFCLKKKKKITKRRQKTKDNIKLAPKRR